MFVYNNLYMLDLSKQFFPTYYNTGCPQNKLGILKKHFGQTV